MDLKENWSKKNIHNHASPKTQQYLVLFGQGKKNLFRTKDRINDFHENRFDINNIKMDSMHLTLTILAPNALDTAVASKPKNSNW